MITIGVIRGALTAILLFAFLALWVRAWSSHRKAEFDAAARLPLEEDEHEESFSHHMPNLS